MHNQAASVTPYFSKYPLKTHEKETAEVGSVRAASHPHECAETPVMPAWPCAAGPRPRTNAAEGRCVRPHAHTPTEQPCRATHIIETLTISKRKHIIEDGCLAAPRGAPEHCPDSAVSNFWFPRASRHTECLSP